VISTVSAISTTLASGLEATASSTCAWWVMNVHDRSVDRSA
jgi:hypothetical protein